MKQQQDDEGEDCDECIGELLCYAHLVMLKKMSPKEAIKVVAERKKNLVK